MIDDADLIGIDLDDRIHVSDILLVQNDGPMFEQGIKALVGRQLRAPSTRWTAIDWPSAASCSEPSSLNHRLLGIVVSRAVPRDGAKPTVHHRPCTDARPHAAATRLAVVAPAAATMMSFALAACGISSVSADLTAAHLVESRNAVVLMSVTIGQHGQGNCMSARLRTLDNKYAKSSEGYLAFMKLSSGTVLDARMGETIGSTQLAPGSYMITEVECRKPVSSRNLIVKSSSPNGLAQFTVQAGEVVNVGKLVLVALEVGEPNVFGEHRFEYLPQVAPLSEDPRKVLHKELAGKLIERPMTATKVPPALLQRACERERALVAQRGRGGIEPTVCTLARS